MLAHFLISQIFSFFLIFCRLGSALMVLPGFGETYVSANIRLCFALFVSLVLMPALGPAMPPFPQSNLLLFLIIANEILIGVFIATVCKIIIAVTHVAGAIFSVQSGISSAVIFDVNQSSQGTLIGNFFGIITIVLLFATDLHYLMLRGITESYAVFPVGRLPPLGDFAKTIAHTVSDTFAIAAQISAPILIIGTLLFLGAGVISRLMPSIQVFFVLTAPQLLVGFFIFITTFSAIMLAYMEFYKDRIMAIMGYLKY
jgi:flagellar biosynthetic protein FliR